MLRNIILLTFIIIFFSCQTETKKDYANDLKNCLSNNDIIELNNATLVFERMLKQKYGSDNLNQSYLTFLEDLSQMDIMPEFFLTSESKDVFARMKKSGTFDKIWITLDEAHSKLEAEMNEEIEFNSNENETENFIKQYEIIVLNPDGEYKKCMLSNGINTTIAELMETQSQVPGINHGFTSKALIKNLDSSSLEMELNKIAIAIGFYYETSYMFQGLIK